MQLAVGMKRALIAIVDAAHARLCTYQQIDDAEPTLQERRDLVNAGRQAHGMWSEKAGSRAQEGGHGAVDDHRSGHLAELDARFAKLVVEEVVRLVLGSGFRHVILVAGPKMMGALRSADAPLRRNDILVDEITQDLAWLTPPQIHDHLAAMKLVDPRPRAVATRGTRTR
jgi:protein required for attachment to host cells